MRGLAGILSLGFALIIGAAHAQFGPAIYVAQPAGGGSFSGAGDVTSFTSWWGASFAYSIATKGTKAVNLCNGGVCADVNSDATTGVVTNAPTINGSACNNSGHICTVHTIYDKVSTHDAVQTTGANQPVWVVDGGPHAGIPCVSFTRASSQVLIISGATIAAASWITQAVAKRNTGQTANQNAIFADTTGLVELYHEHSADNVTIYANSGATVLSVALTDNTWGSIAGNVVAGVSNSYLNVNGTTATVASLGQQPSANQCLGGGGTSCTGLLYDGMICEAGIEQSIASTAIVDSLVTNARSSARYNF